MIIYCRDCLVDGIEPVDIPAYGTIHEGRAICLTHFKRAIDIVSAERIRVPAHVPMEQLVRT